LSGDIACIISLNKGITILLIPSMADGRLMVYIDGFISCPLPSEGTLQYNFMTIIAK